MPRARNNKVDIESLRVSITVKQIIATMSVLALIITTACGYTYAFAQSKSASEMTLHVIEDKRWQVEDARVHSEKDMEILKLKAEIEQLKSERDSQTLSPPPKQPALVEKARKQHER